MKLKKLYISSIKFHLKCKGIDVVFCSKMCRNTAIYSYHKFECGMLETIWNSGSSINCQMAMRLISQRPLSYFRSIRNQLKEDMTIEELRE